MDNKRISTRRRRRQKNTAAEWGHVFLFYVLPFVVFNGLLFYLVTATPSLSCTVSDTNDYLSTEVHVTINTLFPTKELTVTMDGEPLELTKTKNRSYTTTVYKNGSIEASVLNFNGMSATVFEHVNVLDDNPPSIEDASVVDGVLTLTVTDSQSGVDFDSITALTSEGETIEPISVNRDTNTLSYKMDSGKLSIISLDKAGNEARSTITANSSGDVQTSEEEPTETEVIAE
ncbi:MAG: hypothetical protein ACI39W_05165 [Brotaphodocola sp.]